MKRLTLLRLIIIVGLLCLPLSVASAQNYANTNPNQLVSETAAETSVQDDTVSSVKTTSEEIDPDKILAEAGIPNNLAMANNSLETPSTYTFGINDVIDIAVARHPELTGQYAINNEGNIQYEFVGDVPLVGKTKKETTEIVKKLLSKYIISPDVTIKISGYNSKVVYVIGEVAGPGKIYMRGDTITVREALVQSGLPLLSANTPKGSLITPSMSGKAAQRNVNIHKLLIEGDLRENLVMKPGDTLYVPPTLMAKAMRVIQPVATPVGTAAGTARTVYTGGF